ncbi:MAG: uridylate kinase [Methanoregula sp.]|uniref:uridylate kinase n=1 Tax=Methanoregula sp. TaxID=2052170 RepID=UPI003BB069C3
MRRSPGFGQNKDQEPFTVVKLGGSLASHSSEIIPLLQSANRPLLIVPGGGMFADFVRRLDSTISADMAHWMACAAMDQYGWMLASQGMKTTSRLERPKKPRILLPYCSLRRYDPLPHSWDVTSDTIAAWVAGKLGGDLLVLKSVDGITKEGELMTRIEKNVTTDVLDPCFVPYVLRHRIRTFILNGTEPAGISSWLEGQSVRGTVIGTTF